MERRDPNLDVLLDLDGQVFVVDPEGGHWVRFVVEQVPVTPERPHGLSYSLTLHAEDGERLVGFDNAHAHDHRHRMQTMRDYQYTDAATLLSDFWGAVDAMLRERGVIR